jgi:hypothetical protein
MLVLGRALPRLLSGVGHCSNLRCFFCGFGVVKEVDRNPAPHPPPLSLSLSLSLSDLLNWMQRKFKKLPMPMPLLSQGK